MNDCNNENGKISRLRLIVFSQPVICEKCGSLVELSRKWQWSALLMSLVAFVVTVIISIKLKTYIPYSGLLIIIIIIQASMWLIAPVTHVSQSGMTGRRKAHLVFALLLMLVAIVLYWGRS